MINKREYNSDRRRKRHTIDGIQGYIFEIRENITPIGDGNDKYLLNALYCHNLIRENITPIGDGNTLYLQI